MVQSRMGPALVACVLLCCCRSVVSSDPDAEITLEREQIFVTFENNTTFSLMVMPEDTVQDLREDLGGLEGVPWDMHLQVGDTRLDNFNARLSAHNIRAGATVKLTFNEDRGLYTTNFTVRTRDGRTLPIATLLSNTVASLRDEITQLTGIPQADQRLLLKGKQLKDDRKLMLYEIYNGTGIDLVAPPEDYQGQVMTISIRLLTDAVIKVGVNLTDTVSELKERIYQETGVPVSVQRLFARAREITGEDLLCDLKLEADATLCMFLYSSRVTSLDLVARLRDEPTQVGPNKGPIFREVEGADELMPSCGRSLFKDARNWVAQRFPRPGYDYDLFDPIAYWAPNPDNEGWMKSYHQSLESLSRPNASESQHLEAALFRARIKFSEAVRPYRAAVNFAALKNAGQYLGFTLGGGFANTSPEQLVPLGADFNNWAPDAFSDADLMRLFEVSERVRQVLARREGLLCIASQRRINLAILMTYIEALAGYSPPIANTESREGEECVICTDDLTAEPASRLPCEHKFHADCTLTWVTGLYGQNRFPSCPVCRQRFMLPYEILGNVELAIPELQDDREE